MKRAAITAARRFFQTITVPDASHRRTATIMRYLGTAWTLVVPSPWNLSPATLRFSAVSHRITRSLTNPNIGDGNFTSAITRGPMVATCVSNTIKNSTDGSGNATPSMARQTVTSSDLAQLLIAQQPGRYAESG